MRTPVPLMADISPSFEKKSETSTCHSRTWTSDITFGNRCCRWHLEDKVRQLFYSPPRRLRSSDRKPDITISTVSFGHIHSSLVFFQLEDWQLSLHEHVACLSFAQTFILDDAIFESRSNPIAKPVGWFWPVKLTRRRRAAHRVSAYEVFVFVQTSTWNDDTVACNRSTSNSGTCKLKLLFWSRHKVAGLGFCKKEGRERPDIGGRPRFFF